MPFNSKRQGGAQTLLPKGVYRVVIEAVDTKLGPSGHNYLNFRLRPIVNGQKHGQAIWDKISLSPEARFRVENFADALELPDTDEEVDEKSLVGKSFWASVSTREYQGQYSNEIKQYLTPEAAERLLDKQAEEGGFDTPITVPTNRSSRPVSEAAVSGSANGKGKAKAKPTVAELDDEEAVF
jgi:hypothetical protein